MGKQIQFFVDECDFKMIVDFITKQGDICLNKRGEKIREYKFFSELLKIFIWKENLKLKISDTFIDYSDSEVIEFSTRKINILEKKIFPSRFWYETRIWDEIKNNWELKSPELDKKYIIYKKFIQKNFKKSTDKKITIYCGPNAYELYKNGWKMMQGPIVEIHFK